MTHEGVVQIAYASVTADDWVMAEQPRWRHVNPLHDTHPVEHDPSSPCAAKVPMHTGGTRPCNRTAADHSYPYSHLPSGCACGHPIEVNP